MCLVFGTCRLFEKFYFNNFQFFHKIFSYTNNCTNECTSDIKAVCNLQLKVKIKIQNRVKQKLEIADKSTKQSFMLSWSFYLI